MDIMMLFLLVFQIGFIKSQEGLITIIHVIYR